MHDLITKYFDGQLSTEEKQDLFSLVNTDDEFRKNFIAIQNIRGLTSWLPADTDYAETIGKLLSFKQSMKKKRTGFFNKQLIGYAAAIIISVISTWSFFNFSMHKKYSTDKIVEVRYEEFTAPVGQRALIKLQDGTTVWLNARTTLRYPDKFSKNRRMVELDGEAFFDVKENKACPFTVNTEKISVEVTGTKFNIFAYSGNEEFSASLTEGTVIVTDIKDEKNKITLKPNESAIFNDKGMYKENFKETNFLLWKEGIYAFDNVPFSYIVKKLELYYDVEIIVNNKSLEDYKFNGKFRQRDGIENVLKTLMKIKKFTYTRDYDKNIITIRK
jgi:ferric-dicitrate binding protein FerR (iron transport regulator)